MVIHCNILGNTMSMYLVTIFFYKIVYEAKSCYGILKSNARNTTASKTLSAVTVPPVLFCLISHALDIEIICHNNSRRYIGCLKLET